VLNIIAIIDLIFGIILIYYGLAEYRSGIEI